jgi:UDP-2,3-diacylglucosamine hydrolase
MRSTPQFSVSGVSDQWLQSDAMASQWFISDLHLAIERPGTLDLFEHFLAAYPKTADRLFILGDLFDAWIGDDDDAELANRVRQAIRTATDRGVAVFVQRGNRDFLIGRRLMRESGAQLLPDRHVVRVVDQPSLLMHGDLLCIDDVDYQRARRRFRNPLFQWLMLRKSLPERRRIAADYRRRSGEETALKPAEIMDVNPAAVVRELQRHRVRQLIHGHTHRAATHRLTLPDGSQAKRIVLPEWHSDRAAALADDGSRLQEVQIVRDY